MKQSIKKTEILTEKKALLNLLNGYKKTDKLIAEEKKRRLTRLTTEDSQREYDALCRIWEMSSKKEDLERLEKQKIAFLLKRRHLLNKAGEIKKHK